MLAIVVFSTSPPNKILKFPIVMIKPIENKLICSIFSKGFSFSGSINELSGAKLFISKL